MAKYQIFIPHPLHGFPSTNKRPGTGWYGMALAVPKNN